MPARRAPTARSRVLVISPRPSRRSNPIKRGKIPAMNVDDLRAKIRDIKDFPTEGILFKDITTLLKDGPAFRYVIETLTKRYTTATIDIVVGIESRGFILAAPLAHQLGAGFVP